MGCGGSRLGGAAAERAAEVGGVVPLPAGIRPLLRRRLEEMKKRSHASVLKGSQTQSKKELLRHGSSEDGDETEETDDNLKLSAKVAPAPDHHHHVEEKKEVVYEKVSSSKHDVKEVNVKKQDEKIDHDVGVNHDDDEDIVSKKEGNDDGVDHDDEGRMSNFDERMICPGSPSFRVYCINVTSSDDEDDDGDDKDALAEKDGKDTTKSMESESVIIEAKENESTVKKEKRERKGKRFGMALPRKYLANVTAPCYAGRGCMGNNTNSRVVQEKSSQ